FVLRFASLARTRRPSRVPPPSSRAGERAERPREVRPWWRSFSWPSFWSKSGMRALARRAGSNHDRENRRRKRPSEGRALKTFLFGAAFTRFGERDNAASGLACDRDQGNSCEVV